MKVEIPKPVQKDFKVRMSELGPIIEEAEKLNERLRDIYVFRSRRDRQSKKIYKIDKIWLQLEFVWCHRSMTKRDPPPAVIHIAPPAPFKDWDSYYKHFGLNREEEG